MHVESIGNLQDARRLMRGFEDAVGVVSDPAWALHGHARRLMDGNRIVGGYVLAPARMLEDSGVVPPGVILCDRPCSEIMALWVHPEVPRSGRLRLLAAIAQDCRRRRSQMLFGVAMSELSVPLLTELLPDHIYEGPGAQEEFLPWVHVRRGLVPGAWALRLALWRALLAERMARAPRQIGGESSATKG